MGIRAARERARAERPHVTRPEMVLPQSAHPAFQKAGQIFGITTVRTPLTHEYVADVKAMEGAVTENTIAIVASAPNYPFGTIDPVTDVAAIARRHRLHLHVDACVGGFALPFLRRLGEPVPPFDLGVPEVSTISADLHKYAFAARGTSLIVYRDQGLQRLAGFQLDDWSGGPYRTATMAGSRPGGMVAAAWAVLHHFGESGYLEMARTMLDTSHRLRRGIAAIPGLRVLGDPVMYVWGFACGPRRRHGGRRCHDGAPLVSRPPAHVTAQPARGAHAAARAGRRRVPRGSPGRRPRGGGEGAHRQHRGRLRHLTDAGRMTAW